jgi:hypothetical protein
VANDTTDNLLFLNRGGRFEEVAGRAGVSRDDRGVSNGSMGVAVGDPFGSGRPAIFVTNYQHELPALYRNDGDGLFTFASRSSGVAAVGLSLVGFGTMVADLDRDGWEDIAIANGHVIKHPVGTTVPQRPALLRNVGKGRFKVATDSGGDYFQVGHHGRDLGGGAAVHAAGAPVAGHHHRTHHHQPHRHHSGRHRARQRATETQQRERPRAHRRRLLVLDPGMPLALEPEQQTDRRSNDERLDTAAHRDLGSIATSCTATSLALVRSHRDFGSITRTPKTWRGEWFSFLRT